MNEIEVIDGVKGEWRTVTKPKEVTVGQRVRYFYKGCTPCGFSNIGKTQYRLRKVVRVTKGSAFVDGDESQDLFSFNFLKLQAFFPLPVKPVKRKVAKVKTCETKLGFWFRCELEHGYFHKFGFVKSRKSAIRGARRFCKAIGYECEIVKG